MLKLSFYNIKVNDEEGGYILYNSLYKNILQLNSAEAQLYDHIEKNGVIDNELVNALKELNFIVDNDFDELEYYKLLWNRSLYSSGILRHTILPNLACNCDCPYCFENKNGSFMSKETADAYLDWLEPQLRDIRYFYVSWFGGEPLLSKNTIRYITERILEFEKKYPFEYTACLVTNGVLLDSEFIKECSNLRISSVQITLDGDKDIHDKYRFIKGSNCGTFDTIIANLEEYCSLISSNIASILRVNVSDENYDSISSLLDNIPNIIKEKCVLIFRWVYSHSEGRNPGMEFSSKKKGKAPYENLTPLYRLAEQKGFITNSFDEGLNCNFCECDFDHAFQIDQDGDIFMCTHSMDKTEIVGNVRNGFASQRDLSRYAKFINTNPFDDIDCVSCKILPICKGGCRKARYLGQKVCSDVKYSIPSYIMEKAQKI